MKIGVIGVNHKLTTLALRESLVKGTLLRLQEKCSHFHYVYLATCNRVEIYFSSRDLLATHSHLLQLLCEQIEEEVAHKLYSYFRDDCFLHLAKVTAGLDSAILFETEIQGQVKRAYEKAATEHLLCAELHFLFQKSLAIGKRVRALFSHEKRLIGLEETIENIAVSLFGSLLTRRFLFVGLSEINLKIAFYLHRRGIKQIVFCNRSLHKIDVLKGVFPLQELSHFFSWYEYDVTIFGTSCPDYLLKEGRSVEQKHLLIDLSVPRNVHPYVGKHNNITLLNVEQIDRLIDKKRKGQAKETAKNESEKISQSVISHLENFRKKNIAKSLSFD